MPNSHLSTLDKLIFELTAVKLCAGVSVDSVYVVVADKIPELGKGSLKFSLVNDLLGQLILKLGCVLILVFAGGTGKGYYLLRTCSGNQSLLFQFTNVLD